MTLIEKMCRAQYDRIRERGNPVMCEWEALSEYTRTDWLANMRAALAAAREPTEAMLDAPRRALVSAGDYTMHNGEAEAAWHAMIDAALGEEATGGKM